MYGYQSSPDLTNVSFTSNQATVNGGGMYNVSNSSPMLTNVSFTGNQATTSGGGMYNNNNSSSPMLTNVSFSGNLADEGGGMYDYLSNSMLANVSFTGNKATTNGGGMYSILSSPTLTNTILWNNQAGILGSEIYNGGGLNPTFFYSIIKGSGGSGPGWDGTLGIDGGNNLDADPLFVTPVNPAAAPTLTGDMHLQASSPAVDAGNNGACPATDLDGNMRPIDGDLDGSAVCDMGAYEKLIDLFLPLIMR
jgi:predicted outer membrane repeat protein